MGVETLMKIKTQTEAAEWLDRLAERIEQATERFDKPTTGAHLRAAAAEELTRLYVLRAQVYDQLPALFSGGNTATRIALAGARDGAEWSRRQRNTWHGIAREVRAEADRIEREAAPLFVSEPGHPDGGRRLVGEQAAKYRAQARRTHGVPLRVVSADPQTSEVTFSRPVDLDDLDGGA
jgi:hypothetical protein